jgi:hypothetical protein
VPARFATGISGAIETSATSGPSAKTGSTIVRETQEENKEVWDTAIPVDGVRSEDDRGMAVGARGLQVSAN